MLEPLFGLIACLAIYGGVWIVSRVGTEFARDPAFERWCAAEPMLMAFRCSGDVHEARFRLRELIAPHDQLVNLQGGAPWQYYRYDVTVRAVSDSVVAVYIASAVAQRGSWTSRPDARVVADTVALARGAGVEEIWLHGQLHSIDGRSRSRDHRGWLGRVGDDGALEITPMIGHPRWTGADEDSLALHPHAT